MPTTTTEKIVARTHSFRIEDTVIHLDSDNETTTWTAKDKTFQSIGVFQAKSWDQALKDIGAAHPNYEKHRTGRHHKWEGRDGTHYWQMEVREGVFSMYDDRVEWSVVVTYDVPEEGVPSRPVSMTTDSSTNGFTPTWVSALVAGPAAIKHAKEILCNPWK